MLQKLNNFSLPFFIILIFCYAFWLQANFFLNWDISWGLHEAKRLLAGGNYGKDFFEPSPPMFLYLYCIPILITKYFSISLPTAFKISIFNFAFISLLLSYVLAKKMIADNRLLTGLLIALTIIFLALPLPITFGQREHLFLIFTFPYLLLLSCRLQQKFVSMNLLIIVASFTAIGLMIKPFFPLAIIILELYFAYKKRSIFAWRRPEIFILFASFIIYFGIIALYHRDYLTLILPLVLRYHHASYAFSWLDIFNNFTVFFCFFSLLLCLISYKLIAKNHIFFQLLIVFLLGCLLIYIIQGTPWSYHILPAYALSILLSALLLTLLSAQISRIIFIFLIVSVYMVPFYYARTSVNTLFAYKNTLAPITTIIKNYASQQSIYFLSTTMVDEFLIIDDTPSLPGSQYANLSWLAGLNKKLLAKNNTNSARQAQQDWAFFIKSLAKELNNNMPYLVFVDNQAHKAYMNLSMNYIQEFSKNKNFRDAWRAYCYFKSIETPQYNYLVYRRATPCS